MNVQRGLNVDKEIMHVRCDLAVIHVSDVEKFEALNAAAGL